ncbi:DUF4185 domain-containing protein [Flexivirga meconopsidis]|uniref:DUF4185 domain-containing protein n=1 Tax=Flexivirga meconopsidis TaxID=2977121 RepID=UPI00223EC55E|nr:DUF4185 domain-containing protein [Flexivirga meconopsidis]
MVHDESTPDETIGKPSRRTLLAGAAGGLALATGAPTAGASPRHTGLRVSKIGDLTGPDITGRFGVHYADLGIPVRCPDGRDLYVFGDTFGPQWGQNWRSPTALWGTRLHPGRATRFDGTPGGSFARQLIPYDHDDNGITTIIPSDVITLGRTMYLQGVVNRGFGNVLWSGIWTSTDNGETWTDSGARFPADAYNRMWQMVSWDLGPDGWVYIYSCEFLRKSGMILHRVRPQQLTQPDAYQPWGRKRGRWQWGVAPTPVTTDQVVGEMSLRYLDGRWVWAWFNGPDYRIEASVLREPTEDLTTARRVPLFYGTEWDQQDDTHIAQLYGSFVIPGSRLDDLSLTVSQWKTDDNSVYHVSQYRVRGLSRLSR